MLSVSAFLGEKNFFLLVVLLYSLIEFKHSKVGIRKERTVEYVLRHIFYRYCAE